MRKMRRMARLGLAVTFLLAAGIAPLVAAQGGPGKGPDAVRGGQDHRPARIAILRQPISQTVVARQWTVLSVEAVGKPTVQYAKYGTDATSTWQFWCSTDGGSTWIQAGGDMTSEPNALTAAAFQINYAGPLRFEIRKISGGSARINFDDFQVVGY